ncbi:MAG: hypothetical protein QOD07_494 [Frankiaceae bacterium]|jgi:hypothetical protein|nr:hypothetical protein [Frankiaceae bacterium]
MSVRARSSLLAAAALAAVALGTVAAPAGATQPRSAIPPRITTTLTNAKGVLTLTAQGRFLALSMQVTGTEHWVAGGVPRAAPLQAAPVNVHFGKLNVVRVTFPFHRGATAELTYTVQGASAAGVGEDGGDAVCYGAAVVFDGWGISDHPC